MDPVFMVCYMCGDDIPEGEHVMVHVDCKAVFPTMAAVLAAQRIGIQLWRWVDAPVHRRCAPPAIVFHRLGS